MLSFFKSQKTSLIDILPKNFVDIHAHLLPEIDDGAQNLEESIELIQKMYDFGIRNFVCTPHIMEGFWENTPETISTALSNLKSELATKGIQDIKIRAAAEYMLDNQFNDLLKLKNLLTLKGNYLLVEMSYLNPPMNLHEVLFNIQIIGYKPVLAHPERYGVYHKKFDEYKKLKDAGCLFQLNLLSLSSYYGKEVQHTALKLLKKEMIDFVGTDTHHMRHLNALKMITDKKILQLVAPVLERNELLL